jgi:hypothetical protein
MAGIYGNSIEDRARELELRRHLDAHASSIRYEQQLKDAIEDKAREVVKDSGYLCDIFQEQPDRFLDAVAKLIAESEQPARTLEERNDLKSSAYYDFHNTLIDMASELPMVRRLAEASLED